MARSLSGNFFTNRILHERFYMSHVYEEYAVAMLVQHGHPCRLDRRQRKSDIVTRDGIRIEVKSSYGEKTPKANRPRYEGFQFAEQKQELKSKCDQCDFFLLMGTISGIAIIPSEDVLKYGRKRIDVPIDDRRYRKYKLPRITALEFFNKYKDAWYLIK